MTIFLLIMLIIMFINYSELKNDYDRELAGTEKLASYLRKTLSEEEIEKLHKNGFMI